jgi:hypothetical protein
MTATLDQLDFDAALEQLSARWGGRCACVATLDRASGRVTGDVWGTLEVRRLSDEPGADVVLDLVAGDGRQAAAVILRREWFEDARLVETRRQLGDPHELVVRERGRAVQIRAL